MRINLIILCMFCLLISGCVRQSEKTEITEIKIQKTDESQYDILKDGFAFSRNFTSKTEDMKQVEKRMIEISQEYFSHQSTCLDQGKFLDQSYLEKLLASSSVSSIGLNMAKDEILKDEENELPAMRNIISNITEIDFYSREDPSQCSGLAVCLLVNTVVSDYDFNRYEINLDTARSYTESVSQKLIADLRNREELKEVPILLMLYSLKSEDESLPGVMVSKAFCRKQELHFTDIDEKWLIFPSSDAEKEDQKAAMQIQALKEAAAAYTKETVTVFASGHYVDQEMDLMKVTVQTYSGSYLFNLGLVQALADQCDEFENNNLKLMIEIQYYDDVIFTIYKQNAQKKCLILDLN